MKKLGFDILLFSARRCAIGRRAQSRADPAHAPSAGIAATEPRRRLALLQLRSDGIGKHIGNR